MGKAGIGFKLSIMAVMMCDTMSVYVIMPILPFMVSFYLGKDEKLVNSERISEFSGYLEASYRLAQILGILFWSKLSTRYSCKYLIMIGFIGLSLSSLGISLSDSYNFTLFCRAFIGFFCFNSPLLKGLIRETCSDSEFFETYSYFTLGVSISNTLGPLIAITSNLSTNLSFVNENPYFLPFFIMSALGLLTFVMVYIFLPVVPVKNIPNDQKSGILTKKEFLVVVFLYISFGFIHNGSKFLFSVICSTSEQVGGLGIQSEQQASIIQTIAGVFVVIIPCLLQDNLVKKLGLLNAFYLLLAVYIPVSTLYQFFFQFEPAIKIAAVTVVYGLILSVSLMIFSYFSYCISNSVFSDQSTVAHGYSNAAVGFTRFLSNAFYGLFFSWTISTGNLNHGLNAHTSLYLTLLLLLILFLFSFKLLTKSYESKKSRPSEINLPLLKPS